jgi:hypothetical protein
VEGKAKAARNGDKGGAWKVELADLRALKLEVAGLLREQRELLRRVVG